MVPRDTMVQSLTAKRLHRLFLDDRRVANVRIAQPIEGRIPSRDSSLLPGTLPFGSHLRRTL